MSRLNDYILSLADDELILGHRDSEWCGHAPILEEDIAFANLALDEIGHANLWYGLLAGILEQDPLTYPDQLVYFRRPNDYRNIQMVELPNGDWAFSMLRQYLLDAAELVRLNALAQSQFIPLAEVAAKILKEELYHHRHSSAWVRRLGLGTATSVVVANMIGTGIFTSLGGQPRSNIAAITPATGLATDWDPAHPDENTDYYAKKLGWYQKEGIDENGRAYGKFMAMARSGDPIWPAMRSCMRCTRRCWKMFYCC